MRVGGKRLVNEGYDGHDLAARPIYRRWRSGVGLAGITQQYGYAGAAGNPVESVRGEVAPQFLSNGRSGNAPRVPNDVQHERSGSWPFLYLMVMRHRLAPIDLKRFMAAQVDQPPSLPPAQRQADRSGCIVDSVLQTSQLSAWRFPEKNCLIKS